MQKQLKILFAKSPCQLDIFTREFMEEFDIQSSDAKAILELLVSMGHTDIAKVECWHAWAKRLTTRLGVQTHRPNFYDVAARSVSQRVKRRASDETLVAIGKPPALPVVEDLPEEEAADEGPSEPPVKRRRGGGGPWRT